MSRIGINPITVPAGVTVSIDGLIVTAKGKLGELSARLTDDVIVVQSEGIINVKPREGSPRAKQMWGMSRTVVNNLVVGVAEGFTKKLQINGVGYRAALQGKDLVLQLGYSHEVRYPMPAGIDIKCPDQTHIEISGADKQKVGQVAAEIRSYRKPEPYKGKGVKYEDEYIFRKEGKKK